MEAATKRLLSRPSSTSILRYLLSAPGLISFETLHSQVASGYCLRCQWHGNHRPVLPPGQRRHATTGKSRDAGDSVSGSSHYASSAASILEDELFETDFVSPGRKSSRLLSDYLPPAPPMDIFGFDKKTLEHESDVLGEGIRMVDAVGFDDDQNLWRELLDYRRRMYGAQGAYTIFKGMRRRGIDVPLEGAHVDYFWKVFADAALWGPDEFMDELIAYSEEVYNKTGKTWPLMYEYIVGTLLENNLPGLAVRCHNMLQPVHLRDANRIVRVFPHAMSIRNGLKTLRKMLRSVEGHKIHSQVVPVLWERRRPMDAMVMHHFLVERGDRPESLNEIEALVRYAENYGFSTHKEVLYRSVALLTNSSYEDVASLVSEHGVDALTAKMEPEQASSAEATAAEKQKAAKEKKFNDDLGARLFATPAFSFDLILSGLKMFSVTHIGPLSLREMALHSKTPDEVLDHIKALEKAGISIGNSVFATLVRRLAGEKAERTLKDLLSSDQHPDMLERMGLQESLLTSYTLEQNWAQANKTMAVLAVLAERRGYERAPFYNIRLRNALNLGDFAASRLILSQMERDGVKPDKKTLGRARHALLPFREKTSQPSRDARALECVLFLLTIYQKTVLLGGTLDPSLWVEPIARLGMTDQWPELRAILHWLARVYVPKERRPPWLSEPSVSPLGPPPDASFDISMTLPRNHKDSPHMTIFSTGLQRAVVGWGFMKRPSPDKARTWLLPEFPDLRALRKKQRKQRKQRGSGGSVRQGEQGLRLEVEGDNAALAEDNGVSDTDAEASKTKGSGLVERGESSEYQEHEAPEPTKPTLAWSSNRITAEKLALILIPETSEPKLLLPAPSPPSPPLAPPRPRQYVISWCRGIILLRELRYLGVLIQNNTIQRAVRSRLALLYGDAKPLTNSRDINVLIWRENPYTLEEVLADVEKAWGQQLFKEYKGKGWEGLWKLVNPRSRLDYTELMDKEETGKYEKVVENLRRKGRRDVRRMTPAHELRQWREEHGKVDYEAN